MKSNCTICDDHLIPPPHDCGNTIEYRLRSALLAAKEWLMAEDKLSHLMDSADQDNWHPNYSDAAFNKSNDTREAFRAKLKECGL